MSNLFEQTIWYGEGRTDGCPINTVEGFEEDRKAADFGKVIERAVFSQIKQIGGEDFKLYIDSDGVLRFDNTDNLSDEKRKAMWDILHAYRVRVYDRHQFKDWTGAIPADPKEYEKWFEIARDSYLYTIPFKQLLSLSDYERGDIPTHNLRNVFTIHNGSDELTRPNPGLEYYKIIDIKGILEYYLTPFVILSIIGRDVHIEKFNYRTLLVCTTKDNKKIYSSLSTRELYYANKKKLISLGNAYEFLFKYLKLPIGTVLNSVVSVMNFYMLPGEGEIDHEFDGDVIRSVEKAIESPGYKEAEKYVSKSSFFRR